MATDKVSSKCHSHFKVISWEDKNKTVTNELFIGILFWTSNDHPETFNTKWRETWVKERPKGKGFSIRKDQHQSPSWISVSVTNFTFTVHFHALEKQMATHSSVLAWRIPGTGEPGGLPSVGSHRVGHDWSDLAAAAALNYYSSFGWIFSFSGFSNSMVMNVHVQYRLLKVELLWQWGFLNIFKCCYNCTNYTITSSWIVPVLYSC